MVCLTFCGGIKRLQVHRPPWRIVVFGERDHPRAPFHRSALRYGLDSFDKDVSVEGLFDGGLFARACLTTAVFARIELPRCVPGKLQFLQCGAVVL